MLAARTALALASALLLAGCTGASPKDAPAPGSMRDGCAGTTVSLVQGDVRAVVYPVDPNSEVLVRPRLPISVERVGPCSDQVLLVAGKRGDRIWQRRRGDGPVRTRPFRLARDEYLDVAVEIPVCAGRASVTGEHCYGGVAHDTVHVVGSLH